MAAALTGPNAYIIDFKLYPCGADDGDLHGIFHRVLEGHFDSKQAVLVRGFCLVRFHRPTQGQRR
jgi:hypothetical protein